MQLGQKYTVTVPIGSVVSAGATNHDLFQIAPASNVPLLLHRVVVSADQVSAVQLDVTLLRRTTASSVSGGTLTPVNRSPAGPAASCTVSYYLTTLGTPGGVIDSPQWQEFAPYDFNYYPDGHLIVPGTWCCLYVPNAGNTAFPAGFTIDFTEMK